MNSKLHASKMVGTSVSPNGLSLYRPGVSGRQALSRCAARHRQSSMVVASDARSRARPAALAANVGPTAADNGVSASSQPMLVTPSTGL